MVAANQKSGRVSLEIFRSHLDMVLALLDQGVGPEDLRWPGLLIPPSYQHEEVWTMGTTPPECRCVSSKRKI